MAMKVLLKCQMWFLLTQLTLILEKKANFSNEWTNLEKTNTVNKNNV